MRRSFLCSPPCLLFVAYDKIGARFSRYSRPPCGDAKFIVHLWRKIDNDQAADASFAPVAQKAIDTVDAQSLEVPNTTIDQQFRTDHETRFIRSEEHRSLGQFQRRSHAVNWDEATNFSAQSRLRRYLPLETNLADIGDVVLKDVAQRMNNTPRQCLGYRTPNEVFQTELAQLR